MKSLKKTADLPGKEAVIILLPGQICWINPIKRVGWILVVMRVVRNSCLFFICGHVPQFVHSMDVHGF